MKKRAFKWMVNQSSLHSALVVPDLDEKLLKMDVELKRLPRS